MSVEDPVIITCSISGAIANREQCPAIPYTPEEYAAEARRIVDEGGVMIHIHARTPEGTPSYEVEDFRAITAAILDAVDDVIVNYSTGAIGVPLEKRIAYLRELRPEIGALNMGSMNYAKYSKRRKDFVFHTVFENSFETIITFLREMNELGIKPEHECGDRARQEPREVEDPDALERARHQLPRLAAAVSAPFGGQAIFSVPSIPRASSTVAGRRPTSSTIWRAFAIRSPFDRAISPSGR